MKHLGKSKLTKLQAKPDISYILIRLPQSELDHVGETGHIFKTEYNGKPVYVISLDEKFNGELNIIQPDVKSDLEARIEALEKKVNTFLESKNKDDKEKWAR
ncbi:hypothetical protein MSHOH_3699 [Methanosarcina horonobensis HB-1 = JCM 15518]|uniref:Uncharacterized protein n=1 Tax=Methanosarcina horonobensis HB-1 = JCM 15518 TaxID=1434110 RepID=A0A0E3SI90_9EURY|nr:hypothetical protein [Methanosarcina horonobensis]AKB80182.1 hypothetical protein MSHOH_3699 [Methanosarcina horonobensis HB-1 = JCM 15518]